ncbi:MAG TPA: sugar ABC transporter substrate-binding protein [Candidatus Limnocylindrales bacterium]
MNRKLLSMVAAVMLVAGACSGATSPGASAPASESAAPSQTAASSESAAAATAAAPVTLTLWHNYGTEANADVTNALVKAYMAANPNVTINVVSQPADNYFALLKAAAVSGSGPDLMTMWTGLFALQNASYLEPLNQYIPIDTLKQFNGVDWCSTNLHVDQGAICVPLDMQHYNGFYNKDLFAKAGIQGFPTTWDEFFAACAKLKAAGILPLTYGTGGQALNAAFYPYYDLSYLMMFLSVADWQKLYNGQIPWTDPRIVAQLTKWATLHSQGYTNKDVLTNTDSINQFESGKAAMTLEGSWDFKEFHDKMGDKVGVFVPPFTDTQVKGVVEFPGDGFGVTKYSQHKAEAAAFLAWMATPQAQKIIADGGLIPVVAGTSASEPLANAMLDFAANQGYTRYPMIDNVIQPEVQDVATKLIDAVLNGTTTPADATKAMSDALNALPADRRGDTYSAPAGG